MVPVLRSIALPKQPADEVDCAHRHAHPENNAGDCPLGGAFPKGEHEAAENHGDEGERSPKGSAEATIAGQ
jgi:hypothetical protein